MKTMSVTDFKAHALQVIGQVSKTREAVIISKRGTPIAEVIPITTKQIKPGKLAEALVFEKEIISPFGEELWEVCK
jgi:prevent-host-death family protein